MSDPNIEVWLRMYEEQVRHGRHHEEMRAQSTNFVVAISAAALAFISSDHVTADKVTIIAILLIAINVYGWLISLKHYERSRLHVTVGTKYRDIISEATSIGGRVINVERKAGKTDHEAKFGFSRWLRAYALWSGLHLLLAGFGVALIWKPCAA